MPTIFMGEVIDGVGVRGFFGFEGLDKGILLGFLRVRRRFFRFELWAMSCVA